MDNQDNQNNKIEDNPTSNFPGNNNQNHSHQKLFWIGGIIVLVILIIIGGVFYFSSSKKVAQKQANQNQNIQKTDNQKLNQGVKDQNQVKQAKTKVCSTKKLGIVPEYDWTGTDTAKPILIDKVISPDGQHLAYTVDIHHKCFVILDEQKQGEAYDYIGRPVFSPDGQHLAYVVKIGKQHFVILDRKKIKEYNRPIEVKHLTFSPDGQHLAYLVHIIGSKNKHGKWNVVLDGKKQKEYDEMDFIKSVQLEDHLPPFGPIFSPNSRHLAYLTISGKKYAVVLDGKEQRKYEWIRKIIFSPNSQHFIYVAESNGKEFVVLDGKEQKKYDGIKWWHIIFSPDNQHFAYTAESNGKEFVVLDGKEQKKYDKVWDIAFNSDSHYLTYAARSGRKYFIVLDDREQETHYNIGYFILFSPDSQHYAYIVKRNNMLSDKWNVVLDGKKQKEYGYVNVNSLAFSSNGQHLVYVAASGKKNFVVLDGKEQKGYDNVGYDMGHIIFSPDSQHYAYAAKSNGKWFVVLDGKELKEHQGEISNLHFTKNYLNYDVTQDNGEVWFVSKKVD